MYWFLLIGAAIVGGIVVLGAVGWFLWRCYWSFMNSLD